jgi:hypothetical protein
MGSGWQILNSGRLHNKWWHCYVLGFVKNHLHNCLSNFTEQAPRPETFFINFTDMMNTHLPGITPAKTMLTVIVVAAMVLTGCQQKPAPGSSLQPIKEEANNYTNALLAIHQNFLQQSQEVTARSAGLSDIEQQRASMFLYSAFDLVMEAYVYKGDPARPGLTDWMSAYRKFGGDNPHTIYTQIPVDDHYTYRLRGKLGNAFYFGVQVYGYQSGFNLATANIALNNIQTEKDGSFELILSANKPANAKNWLQLTKGDHAVLLRQYFKGRTGNMPGSFTIERTDSSTYVASSYLQRLQRAHAMITEYIKGTLEVCDLLKENAFNQYPKAGAEVRKPKYGGALYPTKDNTYEGCWVSLKKGEAMHLHGFPPANTPYASYVFYDRWYTTPDYRSIRSYLTKDELVLNSDGSFDLYISPEPVDHPNWINTGGLYEGSFSSRYLLSQSKDFPAIKLVNISDIKPKQ